MATHCARVGLSLEWGRSASLCCHYSVQSGEVLPQFHGQFVTIFRSLLSRMEIVVMWLQFESNSGNRIWLVKGPNLNRFIIIFLVFQGKVVFSMHHLWFSTQGVCAANFEQIASRAVVLLLIFCLTSFWMGVPR